MRRIWVVLVLLVMTAPPVAVGSPSAESGLEPRDPAKITNPNGYCLECHREETPGLFEEWLQGRHAQAGVGCLDCHGASRRDRDSFKHGGRMISTLVTPMDCGRCHEDTLRHYYGNAHSYTLKNLRAMSEEDPRYPLIEKYKESDFAECAGCHGSVVELDEERRPVAGWPNSGAGRANPNESFGSCASCHLGHRFSAESARRPETCLACHDGRNYPEGEIFRHSPHGVLYEQLVARKPLELPVFFLDASRFAAPSCGLCHINGAGQGLVTHHNPGKRLARDLTHPEAPPVPGAEEKRENMKNVCRQCHGDGLIDRFFSEADRRLEKYQAQVVQPRLTEFRELLEKRSGKERDWVLERYAEFLAEGKAYRMNLYMGQHGRAER